MLRVPVLELYTALGLVVLFLEELRTSALLAERSVATGVRLAEGEVALSFT